MAIIISASHYDASFWLCWSFSVRVINIQCHLLSYWKYTHGNTRGEIKFLYMHWYGREIWSIRNHNLFALSKINARTLFLSFFCCSKHFLRRVGDLLPLANKENWKLTSGKLCNETKPKYCAKPFDLAFTTYIRARAKQSGNILTLSHLHIYGFKDLICARLFYGVDFVYEGLW